MTTQNRDKRDIDTREQTLRPKKWTPPQLLPDPEPEDGYVFRWIRLATLGNADPVNISSKLRRLGTCYGSVAAKTPFDEQPKQPLSRWY